ncbi:DNA polymerase zeta, partial [Rhizoclosmatium hyalinum]
MEQVKEASGFNDVDAKPFVEHQYQDIPVAWKLAKGPPPRSVVVDWIKENPVSTSTDSEQLPDRSKAKKASQLEGPTQKNKYGYKYSQIQTEALDHELQHLVTMSVEILTHSMRESDRVLSKLPKIKLPDPAKDSVKAVFYCFQGHDTELHRTNGRRAGYHVGMIIVADSNEDAEDATEPLPFKFNGISGYVVQEVETELELYECLLLKVREFDPDILLGYEVHLSSWGYLIERAKLRY